MSSNKNKKDDISNKPMFLFKTKNYIILIVGLVFLVFGFALLSGGGANDYNYHEEVFNFQRIVLAPIIIIIALVLCGISIMIKK